MASFKLKPDLPSFKYTFALRLPKHDYSNQYYLPKDFDYQYIVSVSLFLHF